MPEMHLTKPGFTYSACGTFTKNKERIKKFKESRYIYQNELDKTCFWHDMSWQKKLLVVVLKMKKIVIKN